MKKSINLSIPSPCKESWSEMSPKENGRFCGKCEKVVVDFTQMSDISILQFLENSADDICGRITPSQAAISASGPFAFRQPEFSLRAIVLGLALTTFCALHSSANELTIHGGIDLSTISGASFSDVHNHLTVYVRDDASQAVDSATVLVFFEDNTIGSFTTDSTGKCLLPGIKEFSELRVMKEEFTTSQCFGAEDFGRNNMLIVFLEPDLNQFFMGMMTIPKTQKREK